MTTTIKQARERIHLYPIILVEIVLNNSGPTLRFSDKIVTFGGEIYEDYLSELSILSEELKRATSGSLNSDINLHFKNDPYAAHDYLILIGETYPFEGATITILEIDLDTDGTPSESETLFVGSLDSPVNIDLVGFDCSVSSKNIIQSYKNRRG